MLGGALLLSLSQTSYFSQLQTHEELLAAVPHFSGVKESYLPPPLIFLSLYFLFVPVCEEK